MPSFSPLLPAMPRLAVAAALAWSVLSAGCGEGGPDAATPVAETEKSGALAAEAILHPVGDWTASGRVVLVKKPAGEDVVQIRLKGLEPAIGETQYALWVMSSRHDISSIGAWRVREDRKLEEDIANPTFISYVEHGTKTRFLVTRVYSDDRWRDEILEGKPYDPAWIGQSVLRGEFTGPLVGSSGAS